MSSQATIVTLKKSTPVKRIFTDAEQEFIKLVASIVVNQTIQNATHKNGDMLSQVQPQRSKQRQHRKAGNDNRPLGKK